jgi:tRNA (cmo5U34)-methyltransferase
MITCIDISKNMIDIAKNKLKDYKDSRFIINDFYNYKFDSRYDVAVSSLALHHLVTDKDKFKFYKKIFNALNKNGVFYNADVVTASDEKLQDFYMSKWIDYMSRS